ncbi:MAG: 8-amino-7-oxononanoate synthase [Gammaproteobacteria bacterium]|nr:8-amino-7-oxononanoate synthase [Gammaproteobacteria bacterium]
MKDLKQALEARRQQHLYRQRRVIAGPQQPHARIDGQEVLSFCSNDYLGLANHPRVIQAFQQAANDYGVGSGAAHLVNGHSHVHHQLEEELAAFVGRPRALLFSTGYMANIGTVNALLGRGDHVFEDRLNHASLIDAGLISQASFQRYNHADLAALANRLKKAGDSGDKLIVADAVFSMDGDLAPLPQMAQLAQEHNSWLMVDDAHGFGVLGEHGQGSLEHFGLNLQQVPILIGTLGKAMGTAGAFVAGDEDLIEYLINEARIYISTTAMPPAVAEATRTSLQLVSEESWRRAHVLALVARFRSGAQQLGLNIMPSITPIQPLLVGEADTAISASEALLQQGILVSAIRPPTVPKATARLRITFSAAHSEEDVDRLLTVLESIHPMLNGALS